MSGSTTHPQVAAPGPVERYVEFWNAATPDEQRRLAAEAFADGVSYHVPLGVMRGSEELIGFRNQFAESAPGYEFRPRAEPDAHHDRARLQWELLLAGESFATGTDVLVLDGEGQITSITGFLDRPPEGFNPAQPGDRPSATPREDLS